MHPYSGALVLDVESVTFVSTFQDSKLKHIALRRGLLTCLHQSIRAAACMYTRARRMYDDDDDDEIAYFTVR